MSPQFLRFLLAGGIAAGANFGSRFVFSQFLTYGMAIFCAYLIGMVTAFLLMRGHVFDTKSGALTSQVLKFVGVNVLAVSQTMAISFLLARWLSPLAERSDHVEAFAHLAGVLVPVVTSYFGHKFLTFR